MPDQFAKFPRTPHLFWLGSGSLRDDKLLDPAEADRLLQEPQVLAELGLADVLRRQELARLDHVLEHEQVLLIVPRPGKVRPPSLY